MSSESVGKKRKQWTEEEIDRFAQAENEEEMQVMMDSTSAASSPTSAPAASSSIAEYDAFAPKQAKPVNVEDEQSDSAVESPSDSEPAPPKKKQKKQKVRGADSVEDPQVASDSDSNTHSSSDSEEDNGLLSISAPRRTPLGAAVIPPDTDFLNPNNALRYFSIKNGLNVHYTQLNPETDLHFHASKPDPKNKQNNRIFYSIQSKMPQRFDFMGGTNFKPVPFKRFVCIGPFGVLRFPRGWPYGDRDKLPNSQFPAPKTPGDVRLRFPYTSADYTNSLSFAKEGVGMLDMDADMFMSRWVRGSAVKWLNNKSWENAKTAFQERYDKLLEKVVGELKGEESQYQEDYDAWKKASKKNPKLAKPSKPDLSEARREKLIQAQWNSSLNPIIRSKDGLDVVGLSAPVLSPLTVKERSQMSKSYSHPDPEGWFNTQYHNPPDFVNADNVRKPGFPRKYNETPLFRCVTFEEAKQLKAQGMTNKSLLRLMPVEERHIMHDDVVAPILSIDRFDTKLGSGFRFELLGLIWLGERHKFNENVELPPFDELDPTTYVALAQPYTRTKDFRPQSVENPEALADNPVNNHMEQSADFNAQDFIQ